MDDADLLWWDDAAHPEYSFILSGAHRRRLTPLGAPALVRHLAFWNATAPERPKEKKGRKKGPDTDPRGNDPEQVRERALAADECIGAIYRRLIALHGADRAIGAIDRLAVPDALDDDLVVLFAGVIDKNTGEPIEGKRVEHILTDSYRAIKLNFHWHGIETKLNFELHSEYVTMTTILDLSGSGDEGRDAENHILTDICEALGGVCEADLKVAEQQAHLWRDRLYDWVWDEFSQDILSCLKENTSRLGLMFVDFRGLVVRPQPPSTGFLERFALPRSKGRGSGGPVKNPPKFCEPAHLQRVWPLIRGFGLGGAGPAEEADSSNSVEDTEYTVSLFLDGRAVYATALGSQASLLTTEAPKPLYYFLYEDTLFPWQLGRLVYRIHRAGTARLAAMMHFGKLRDAHEILGEIETRLEKDMVRPFNTNDVERLRSQLRKLNDKVEKDLAEISNLNLETSLESRVERSRYYVRQFKATVESLRIDRVDGYQTYQEFVEQRLSPMFDYIDRLGRKWARIQQDRLLLIGRIQALDSQYETNLIANAQRIADYGLSCVLGPYYAAYSLSHALSGFVPERAVWLGALFFCPMVLKTILHREKTRWIEEQRRQDKAPPPHELAAQRRWNRWLNILGARRLTVFFRLGLLALFLGTLADYLGLLARYPPESHPHEVASERPLMAILILIMLLVVIEAARGIRRSKSPRRRG